MFENSIAKYTGHFNARILENLGYQTKEDLLNARVLDFFLIGSFYEEDIENIIHALAKAEMPSAKDRLANKTVGSLKGITVFGLTKEDTPSEEIKSITIREVIHLDPLTRARIHVLFRILAKVIYGSDILYSQLRYRKLI